MTRWQSTRLVAARELGEALRRRLFWVVVAVLFLASLAGVLLPEVLDSGRTTYQVTVVGGSPELDARLTDRATEIERALSGRLQTELQGYRETLDAEFAAQRERGAEAVKELLGGEVERATEAVQTTAEEVSRRLTESVAASAESIRCAASFPGGRRRRPVASSGTVLTRASSRSAEST